MTQPSYIGPDEDAQARELDALLAVVARLAVQNDEQICCHDITMSEYRALKTIEGSALPGMQELIDALGLTKSGATRVVDRLEDKGYARRVQDLHDDARFKAVRLTAKGTKLLATIATDAIAQRQALLTRIPPEHRQTVLDGLRVLKSTIQRCC